VEAKKIPSRGCCSYFVSPSGGGAGENEGRGGQRELLRRRVCEEKRRGGSVRGWIFVVFHYFWIFQKFYQKCRTRHHGGLKKLKSLEKNRFLASCSLMGKGLCLRSRHLVLWSLGTLTG